MDKKLKLSLTKEDYAICRLHNTEELPVWPADSPFFSVTRTPEELSVVCRESDVPYGAKCEKGWRMLRIEGPLDFSLIGVLASISTVLAQKSISIFVVSTFDTDYILVKSKDVESSISALAENGYDVKY